MINKANKANIVMQSVKKMILSFFPLFTNTYSIVLNNNIISHINALLIEIPPKIIISIIITLMYFFNNVNRRNIFNKLVITEKFLTPKPKNKKSKNKNAPLPQSALISKNYFLENFFNIKSMVFIITNRDIIE